MSLEDGGVGVIHSDFQHDALLTVFLLKQLNEFAYHLATVHEVSDADIPRHLLSRILEIERLTEARVLYAVEAPLQERFSLPSLGIEVRGEHILAAGKWYEFCADRKLDPGSVDNLSAAYELTEDEFRRYLSLDAA